MKRTARREAVLLLGLLFIGLILMPFGIYLVGREIFGDYGGHGYDDFFGTLTAKIRNGPRCMVPGAVAIPDLAIRSPDRARLATRKLAPR